MSDLGISQDRASRAPLVSQRQDDGAGVDEGQDGNGDREPQDLLGHPLHPGTRRFDLAPEEFIPEEGDAELCRDRTVRVAEWAWPYVERLAAGKLPDAPLFPGLKRNKVGYHHRRVCRLLGIREHELRDARHCWAVRAAKAGTPAEIIARQLGHADAVMVLKVYGRFLPSRHDRDKWERIAAMQDAEQVKEAN